MKAEGALKALSLKDIIIEGKATRICEFFEGFEEAKKALEKQIPKKPYFDDDNGFFEKEHCPTCHRSLFPNDHHCKCGQALDWSDEG